MMMSLEQYVVYLGDGIRLETITTTTELPGVYLRGLVLAAMDHDSPPPSYCQACPRQVHSVS